MPVPDFSPGEVLTAAAMDSIGLWLVKTQTVGAGVSTVIVTDAFSATYDNYLIQFSNVQLSVTNDSVLAQMRTGTTTATSGYFFGLPYVTFGAASAVAVQNNGPSWNNVGRGIGTNDKVSFSLNVNAPFLTSKTIVSSQVTGSDLTGASGGYHNSATSYDQIVFSTNAGNMTGGTIRVYGYRN